jgi:hypothetical protein
VQGENFRPRAVIGKELVGGVGDPHDPPPPRTDS